MNTTQLECFMAVADKLNFTKAAQELYFSTPTVTHHIQQLEEELKVKLFIRNKKSVQLTQAGKQFYPEANDILMKYQSIKQRLLTQQKKEMLRIGCSSHAELIMMTSLLHLMKEKYPYIEPYIMIQPYDHLLDMLRQKQLDLVLATENMIKKVRTEFQYFYVKNITSYALVPLSHPFSDKTQISFNEMAQERLIGLHNKLIPFSSENTLKDLMKIHEIHHHDIICDNDQVCLTLAKAGYGIAVLPDYCIPEYYASLGLARIPIKENDDYGYGVICEKGDIDEPYRYFISLLQKKYRAHP